MLQPWKTWTEEPWDATMNGTIHRAGRYLGEMDEPDKERPGYASDADVANAHRAAACVNALSEVPAPAAIPEAIAAHRELLRVVEGIRDRLEDPDRERIEAALGESSATLRALDQHPDRP